MKKLQNWLALSVCAGVLAACGGGGGSPGEIIGTPPIKQPSSVVLIASGTTIVAPSGEVQLTAIVKDGNNSVMPGQTVTFKASSGNISNTGRITDGTGSVTEKLSIEGDASVRTITVSASASGVNSATLNIQVVAPPPAP